MITDLILLAEVALTIISFGLLGLGFGVGVLEWPFHSKKNHTKDNHVNKGDIP